MTENTTKEGITITPVPQRTYKDRIFRMIFKEKKELLGLYNAINGTDYIDQEALHITTLENAIYMNVKNDLSFLIDSRLSLYEHQSTNNPNIPLRNLFYVSDLYSAMTKDRNLYGETILKLPTPKFVVFYNGTVEQPERKVLKLSDAFEIYEQDKNLDLKVLVLNINPGYNTELMEKCRTLKDYMEYVERVRNYARQMSITKAVEKAVDECIKDDILADFLKTNRAEAERMSIYEYDEEKHLQQIFAEGKASGFVEGKVSGFAEGEVKGIALAKKILRLQAEGKSVSEIAAECSITEEKAEKILG